MIKANLPTSQLTSVKLDKSSAARNILMEGSLHLVLCDVGHPYHRISPTK